MSHYGYVVKYQWELKQFYLQKNQEMQGKDDPYEAQKWIDEYVAVQKRMGKSVPTRNFLTLF